ncbi:hypothetical protein BX600DRAFT_470056 [Xylariales sp. PMI_506]|nr:hypothetical protein BX600DRAFT_470056 [Xylariales sp. PMI_506]
MNKQPSNSPPQEETSPPPYSKVPVSAQRYKSLAPEIPHDIWDLATTISDDRGFLHLGAEGRPTWQETSPTVISGCYMRDGFCVYSDRSSIEVTNKAYTWICNGGTAVELLRSNHDHLRLMSINNQLILFQQTIKTDRFSPKPAEDKKGCLQVKSESTNVWTITGTDIYRVVGYEHDLVVRSPKHLRLWDLSLKRWRWERDDVGVDLLCFSPKYVIVDGHFNRLIERQTGRIYGEFMMPLKKEFFTINSKHHFGPVVSRQGLVLYKLCPKAFYILDFSDKNIVKTRVWESEDEIQGSLVLRGSLENLELELLEQEPMWTKYELENEKIFKYGMIKKMVM